MEQGKGMATTFKILKVIDIAITIVAVIYLVAIILNILLGAKIIWKKFWTMVGIIIVYIVSGYKLTEEVSKRTRLLREVYLLLLPTLAKEPDLARDLQAFLITKDEKVVSEKARKKILEPLKRIIAKYGGGDPNNKEVIARVQARLKYESNIMKQYMLAVVLINIVFFMAFMYVGNYMEDPVIKLPLITNAIILYIIIYKILAMASKILKKALLPMVVFQ